MSFSRWSTPYFKAMLDENYKEINQEGIILHDIDGATLNKIIIFFLVQNQN